MSSHRGTEYYSNDAPRADLLEVSDHAKERYAERFDPGESFPADVLRQIVASAQRHDAGVPPHVDRNIAVVVDYWEKRIVTVYPIAQDEPKVVRA